MGLNYSIVEWPQEFLYLTCLNFDNIALALFSLEPHD